MGAEAVNPYCGNESKREQVKEMFDSIAPAYDFMNTAMTFGLHRYWRDSALRSLNRVSPRHILDVATGTGDVAFRMLDMLQPEHITGIDLSEGMLDIARRKLASRKSDDAGTINFLRADCLDLPFPGNSFDAVTVAYGVRNFERLAAGYAEMLRVLRPGGMICVIELSEPASTPMRMLYRLYARHIIPMIGSIVSGDRSAYEYLPRSIAAAPQRDDMTRIMAQVGFCRPQWKTLTFGTVCIYTATKPEK